MRAVLMILVVVCGACDETQHSNFYDLGAVTFKHIGDPCRPDVPPNSECGYWPRFYCTPGGICTSACHTPSDCGDGAVCVGAGDMVAGECRLAGFADGGG
jgi:hypothetical protein